MRLSHINSLRLPFGRLLSCDLPVQVLPADPVDAGELAGGAALDELPVSFDQHRHVSMGNRAGSWMALSFRLPHPVPTASIGRAWRAVVGTHGTLQTIFLPDDESPQLRRVSVGEPSWREHEISPGQPVHEALREVLDAACSPYERPSHRLCVIETADGPHVVVASDHSHVDLWSLLVLVRDLLAALEQCLRGEEPQLPAVPEFAEHTRELLERPAAPPEVSRRWSEILDAGGGVMPRFPLPLGEPVPHPERVEVRDVLGVVELAAYSSVAAEAAVSTLALTVSVMTETTITTAGAPLRVVFPVHSRSQERWHDSVGWFITNSVLESADPDPAACALAVREAVRLGSWPLAPIMAPYGGMPEAPGMFAVSWLDLRRLPVRIDAAGLGAHYVSAAIRTSGVMLWFIVDETGVHLRCRYPDTVQARQSVGSWLDELVFRMRARARELRS